MIWQIKFSWCDIHFGSLMLILIESNTQRLNKVFFCLNVGNKSWNLPLVWTGSLHILQMCNEWKQLCTRSCRSTSVPVSCVSEKASSALWIWCSGKVPRLAQIPQRHPSTASMWFCGQCCEVAGKLSEIFEFIVMLQKLELSLLKTKIYMVMSLSDIKICLQNRKFEINVYFKKDGQLKWLILLKNSSRFSLYCITSHEIVKMCINESRLLQWSLPTHPNNRLFLSHTVWKKKDVLGHARCLLFLKIFCMLKIPFVCFSDFYYHVHSTDNVSKIVTIINDAM